MLNIECPMLNVEVEYRMRWFYFDILHFAVQYSIFKSVFTSTLVIHLFNIQYFFK